jgi:hypothetical protein
MSRWHCREPAFPSRIDHADHISTRQYANGSPRSDCAGRTTAPIHSVEPRRLSSTSRRETCAPCRFCSATRRLRARSATSASISRMPSRWLKARRCNISDGLLCLNAKEFHFYRIARRPSDTYDRRLATSCGFSKSEVRLKNAYATKGAFPIGPEYRKHAQIAAIRRWSRPPDPGGYRVVGYGRL